MSGGSGALRFLNFNIQSFQSKQDHMEACLVRENIDVVCLTEHWLKDNIANKVKMKNYNISSMFCRSQHIHGGVLLAIRKNLRYKSLEAISALSAEKIIEMTATILPEINMVIMGLYRVPGSCTNTFLERLESALEIVFNEVRVPGVLVMGDYNIDFLKSSQEGEALIHLMASFRLQPLFKKPSRMTERSETCIDNIFSNIGSVGSTATINPHLSDHYAQIVDIKINTPNPTKTHKCRMINATNLQNLKARLNNVDWDALDGRGANEAYNCFHTTFMDLFNITCPEKEKTYNQQKRPRTPRDPELDGDWNRLQALEVIYRCRRDEASRELYRRFKQYYHEKLTHNKQLSNETVISTAHNKQRAIWKLINSEVRGRGCDARASSDILPEDFNNFFSTIAQRISGTIQDSGKDPLEHLERAHSCFFLRPVSQEEVLGAVRKMHPKDTIDTYGCSSAMIKTLEKELASPLAKVINKCFEEGEFPQPLKIARIAPVPKNRNASKQDEYRPIAILPVFSKIMEICIKERLIHYFENKVFLKSNQHGYRNGKSTVTAAMELLHFVTEALDRREEALVSLCDLSKAFDLVSHDILLQKLDRYGVRGIPLRLLQSYLKDRIQYVAWEGQRSTEAAVNIGVPQGSILGPILFIIYLNDLPESMSGSILIIQFADDTSILTSGDSIESAKLLAKESLDAAGEWFNMNKLKQNPNKTKQLLISTRSSSQEQATFLGLTLDTRLTWKSHISELVRKLSPALYCIRRLMRVATYQCALLSYHTQFHSVATYGILFWGVSTDANNVFIMQKKALRLLNGLRPGDTCRTIFRKSRILTIPAVYILQTTLFVHKNVSHHTRNCDVHHYQTRRGGQLRAPLCRLKTTQSTSHYWGPILYNKLPEEIRDLPKQCFKTAVRTLLWDIEPYSIQEYLQAAI